MFRQLIDRPIAVTMALVALLVMGAVASTTIPVSLVPDVAVPQITVQVASPTSSARELEESVVAPLRSQLIQISHLSDIRTETKDGSGNIVMLFEYGVDVDYIFIEVNEKIDRAMSSLPREMERPKVLKASATDIPAFYINMNLREPDGFIAEDDLFPVSSRFMHLSNFAEQVIVKRIEQLPQVAMVDVSGVVYPEILIVPDNDKLKLLNITPERIESALRQANIALGNLTIRDGEYQYNVRLNSTVENQADIENIYLKIADRLYQVKDLALVREHPQPRTGLVRSDGRDAICLAVIKQYDARMSELKKGINNLLEHFKNDYPEFEFTVTRDQTELLDYSIDNLIQNIIVGAILACLIMFFFMQDFRSPLLVMITIPTALVLSLLLFSVLHITINIISLSGLVLGLGMMVDNSIVVIDNITFRWGRGEPLKDAVVDGAQEVFAPMLSSVLTTCAVFVPLIFLSGISGALFYDQAMAVSISLFSSLFVTVMVIPVFYYLIYKKQTGVRQNRFLKKVSFDKVLSGYDGILKWFFRRRGVMWTVIAVSIVGIGALFAVIKKEKLPPMTHNDALVSIEWNERISARENGRRTEAMLALFPDLITQTTVMAGVQQFILSHTDETSVSEATVYIQTENNRELDELTGRISEYMKANYPNAIVGFNSSGNIFDMIFSDKEAKLVARLRSVNGQAPDPLSLNQLLSAIARELPWADIQPVAWEEHILYVTKPEIMALYGVGYSEVLYSLRNALNDNRLFSITKGRFSVPVVMGENKQDIRDVINHSFIRKQEIEIPISLFLIETKGRDLKNIVSGAEGNYYPLELSLSDKQVPGAVEAIRRVVQADDRFEASFSGTYFSSRGMVRELAMVLSISLLLLFFILAAQFESLVQPLIILLEIVTDLFGALLVLWVFGSSLNLMSLIGIVVMCGIVINDSILKVDTINKLRRGGYSIKRAIFEGGRRRLKPIIMTSLTTILAVAPFLVRGDMGSDLQFPLSLALIGGMVVGTFVSIFFVPLVYYDIYKNKDKR